MPNPYAPVRATSSRPEGKHPRFPLMLLLFLPGCILGLQLGSVFEHGVKPTIQRTTIAPTSALMSFAIFSLICLGITCIYRIPRFLLAGPHPIRWYASLLSGTLMVSGSYISVIVLRRIGVLSATAPRSFVEFATLLIIVIGFTIIAVELEAVAGGRTQPPEQYTDKHESG